MRIAIFTEVFLPKVDGIVNTLCRLLDYLAKEGHESLLVAPQPAPNSYSTTKVISIPSKQMPFYPEIRLASPWYPMDGAWSAFHPDLVHIVNPIALGLIGMRFAQKHQLPVVASYHTDLPGFASRWGMGIVNESLWAYLRFIHNQADLNLCPSQATLDSLAEHDFQRLKVWSRGVDTDLFHPMKAHDEWRWRLSGGEPGKPLLLYTGRLSAEKRIDWLVPVLRSLPEARLAIVGDGPQRHVLEASFRGMPVVFTGYLNGEDLAAAYASSDLFVFPAANETFGNVVLEAMASGLPVITPGAGGPLDFVGQGQNGFLFDPERVESLIHHVSRLVKNPDLAHSMGQVGRKYAERRDWGSIFDCLLLDYQQAIDRKRMVLPGTGHPRIGLPTLGF